MFNQYMTCLHLCALYKIPEHCYQSILILSFSFLFSFSLVCKCGFVFACLSFRFFFLFFLAFFIYFKFIIFQLPNNSMLKCTHTNEFVIDNWQCHMFEIQKYTQFFRFSISFFMSQSVSLSVSFTLLILTCWHSWDYRFSSCILLPLAIIYVFVNSQLLYELTCFWFCCYCSCYILSVYALQATLKVVMQICVCTF